MAEAIRFREILGFPTEPSFVASIPKDPASDDPIPLTADESAELARRLYVQEHTGPLVEWGLDHPDRWGGAWTDHLRGGLLVIQLTAIAQSEDRADLSHLAPAGAKVEVRSVSNSEAQLLHASDAVAADMPMLQKRGVNVTDVLVRTDLNRTEILVVEPSAEAVDYLLDRYGGGLVTVTSIADSGSTACSSRSNCIGPPLRAGISGSFGCSVSFVGYKGNPRKYHLFTAGHCAGNGSAWFHNGVGIGTMSANSTYDGSTADVAIIGPMSSGQISRWVYRTSVSVNIVTSRDSPFDDQIGDLVCLSAKMAAAVRCGTVTGLHGHHQIQPGVVLDEQYYANYAWQGGDSGGAVFYGARAIGIQSGFAGSWATFSHIHYAQSRTGAWVNVDNCGNFC